MIHLTTVRGEFEGRVVAARLGAEGILAELRGCLGGIYPIDCAVEVWVEQDAALEAGMLVLEPSPYDPDGAAEE